MEMLGNRIKNNYEDRFRFKLTRRTPVIMRLDGRAFHTLTRGLDKPFDETFISSMVFTAEKLLDEIQGAKCAYVQSDEINILITDFDKLTTDAWFDYNIQKMCSIASGIASVEFSEELGKTGIFDCRVFNIPKEEVTNYFIWRQKDWERNSLQMFAQSHFSTKQLHKKNKSDMHEMLHKKSLNWNDLSEQLKNGTLLLNKERVNTTDTRFKSVADCRIITDNRHIIDDLLVVTED